MILGQSYLYEGSAQPPPKWTPWSNQKDPSGAFHKVDGLWSQARTHLHR